MTLHTYNRQSMSLPSINFLHLRVSEIQPRQDFIGQIHYAKVKSRSHHDVAYLQPPTNVPTKYQHLQPPTNVPTKLPTPYHSQGIARTTFYKKRSLQQGQRSNQCHTMTLHTYNPQPMSLPSIEFLHLPVSKIYIAQTRFSNSRSLWQGQMSKQGHTMTLHTYIR